MTPTTPATRSSCECPAGAGEAAIDCSGGLQPTRPRALSFHPPRCSARLRATDIPPSSEAARLLAAALPRSSLHSPEGVASALTAAAAPRGSQAPVEEVSRRVAQAADSFALRDTGLPIVMGFSSASGPHSHAVRVGGAGRR